MLDVENCSPQDWVNEASLDELWVAFRNHQTWKSCEAEVFDYTYRFKMIRLMKNCDVEGLTKLGGHLKRLVLPSQRDKLNALRKPYATYWQSYALLIDNYVYSIKVTV